MSRQNWEQLVQNLIAGGILRSPQVIHAMRQVNRALFLPDKLKAHYTVDSPLPIGEGQTVSAPHDLTRSD
jgi:protein-L-isoaspartate(D-aspartate) O-methyltransferase